MKTALTDYLFVALFTQNDLKFITFDGDQTLYDDGQDFYNSKLLRYIVKLLKNGVHVALVTAAGYKDAPEKYEKRLSGLLQGFRDMKVSSEVTSRFYVLGGECNYLFKCDSNGKLFSVPEEEWHHEAKTWTSEEIRRLLDTAETSLRSTMANLKLRSTVIRKERAVGIIPGGKAGKSREPGGSGGKSIRRELLDEAVLAVQHDLAIAQPPITVPFCAFNVRCTCSLFLQLFDVLFCVGRQ